MNTEKQNSTEENRLLLEKLRANKQPLEFTEHNQKNLEAFNNSFRALDVSDEYKENCVLIGKLPT